MDGASLVLADLARLLQYAGASVLFGTALFALMSLPRSGEATAARQGWPRPLFAASAVLVLIGSGLSLLAQSASMNGVPLSGLDAAAVETVITDTQWGHAIVARMALSLLALIAAWGQPGNGRFGVLMTLGLLSMASFAFTGHGAADDGPTGLLHLVSDMIHSVAAGVWLGALAGFFILLARPAAAADPHRLALTRALAGFATTGTVVVAVLVVTGLVNSYFLVGIAGLPKLFASAYGQLLALKLVVFIVMLGLAAGNRFRLTPALARAQDTAAQGRALSALKRSIVLEAAAGLAILALVAVFGMLEPPDAL